MRLSTDTPRCLPPSCLLMHYILTIYVMVVLMSMPYAMSQTNVALHKPGIGSTDDSLKVMDGDDTTCAFMVDAFFFGDLAWIVDLEMQYQIDSIRLITRPNSYIHYDFANFYVYVSDENPYPDLVFTKGMPFPGIKCFNHEAPITARTWYQFPCETSKISGRFVTLWLPDFTGFVYLCEFEVISAGGPVLLPSRSSQLEGSSIGAEIHYKKRMWGEVPYHTRVLDRPNHAVCVVECFTAASNNTGSGTHIFSQLNIGTGVCECSRLNSFQHHFTPSLLYHDLDWSVMEMEV